MECNGCLYIHPTTVDEMPPDHIQRLLGRWVEVALDDWRDLGARYTTGHPLLGDILQVESVGGEGQGDHCHLVWQIGSRLFRLDGYYVSHDGFHFDGKLYVVQRREKTVTVYE